MTKSILTEEEKWYFDLHGFLILKDVITAKNLKQMLNIIQNWLEMDESNLPPPVTRGRQEPCKTHINNIQYGDKIFQDLAMDPQILRVVAGLTMNSPRLFLYNFTMMIKPKDPSTVTIVDLSFLQIFVIHTMITKRETVRFTVAISQLGSHS